MINNIHLLLWNFSCSLIDIGVYIPFHRRTKREVEEQDKLREQDKRSEQKKRDKERREAERAKMMERTMVGPKIKTEVTQVILNGQLTNFYEQ